MAYNFKDQEEVKEYINNIGIEYRFSCFKEKNSEGCHLLGEYLETIKKEFSASAKIYQSNCDEHKYPRSCLKYGTFCYLGKGVEENINTSFEYYKKACDVDDHAGCLYSGVMLTKEEKLKEKNYVEGLKYLEKSCSLGNVNGCYFASGIYLSGAEGVSKDQKKFLNFSLLACNGGNVYACMNLSQMYKKGDGVEQDLKKASEFKERAKEIRENMKKKQTIRLQEYT